MADQLCFSRAGSKLNCGCYSKGEPGIILDCVLGLIHHFCLGFNVVLKSKWRFAPHKGFFFRVVRISLFCLALRPGVLKSTDKPDCLGPPLLRSIHTPPKKKSRKATLPDRDKAWHGGGQVLLLPGTDCLQSLFFS
jgi:hypothetical protein